VASDAQGGKAATPTRRDRTPKWQAQRALERQLAYQQKKAKTIAGREVEMMARMQQYSSRVRSVLEKFQDIDSGASVIEVGSGAHGLIFFFGANHSVGVDPLAVSYRTLFPGWQGRVQTVAAVGEQLPFRDQSFDVVLCDNVVDHAESPQGIVGELVRIMKPGGLMYFTVNIHHSIYSVAARAHSTWNALGVAYEIGPFADHTTHLTLSAAQQLFRNLPLSILHESSNISESKAKARKMQARHLGDSLKRIFFKNALYEVVARKV
jgi:ubiquinone/menaquinone biosynthesis C-methylase UbiE